MKLPDKEFKKKERRQATKDTARWFETHPEDTSVRTQYLTYLMKLPDKEFKEERRQATKDTARWLGKSIRRQHAGAVLCVLN